MTHSRPLLRLLVLVPVCLGLAGGSGAGEGDRAFTVIVNPDDPITSVDRELLRDAYLKKTTEWPGGATIRPIDLSSRFPARRAFTHDILRKTPDQLRTYWNQQIFSGKGVPPPEASSTDELIRYVVSTRGAVGYLPAGVDPGPARPVEVE